MPTNDSEQIRVGIRVSGLVQGVGFRPHVYGLAVALGLTGWVGNDSAGVFIEAEGTADTLAEFRDLLVRSAPPLASIADVQFTQLTPTGTSAGFAIVESKDDGLPSTLISPDTATCDDCIRELYDPADRRFRYPFINCTNCGPRFSIVRGVPYDRPATTMSGFALCDRCAREYHDPTNRRFHAQPVCCPACGPRLRLTNGNDGPPDAEDPIKTAAALLSQGAVVAIKGLGGYHLAADASSDTAVSTLRARKHREDRAFALMAPSLSAAEGLCHVDPVERELLTARQRPIVLLARRDTPESPHHPHSPRIADAIAPGNRHLGIMLPYTPLHHLLCREFARPLVLTSGNISDEPIAYKDEDAFERLSGIADYFLTHDRPIHTRVDDSVLRVFNQAPFPIRRSRGYAPSPTPLATPLQAPVLGCGAELKNTFCLAKGSTAFISHHIGDLANHETLLSFTEGIAHYSRMFDIVPRVVAYDLHPEYLSTKYALALPDVELIGVQHHHAHIASCMAEHGVTGPVIGVAFDGLGFGPDGTLWGGEFLIADLVDFRRVGHLSPVPMPGGTAAIRQPWRMAAAYLDAAYEHAPPANLPIASRHRDQWSPIIAMSRSGLNSPHTTSAGRLFDAVAALLDIRDSVTFEGQAAIELEQQADPHERSAYPTQTSADGTVDTLALIRAIVEDQAAGTPTPTIAARFHNALADAVVRTCAQLREAEQLAPSPTSTPSPGPAPATSTVALSGGVFQNMLLLTHVTAGLQQHGFRVLTHRRVPTNDGGISLGQTAIAAARTAATS